MALRICCSQRRSVLASAGARVSSSWEWSGVGASSGTALPLKTQQWANDLSSVNGTIARGMATTSRRGGKKSHTLIPKFLPKNTEIVQRYPPDAELPPAFFEESHDLQLAKRMEERWKPGLRKRPLRVSITGSEEFLEDEDDAEFRWIPGRHKRVGALALKLGMMPVWDDWGVRHACTVLWLDSNVVLRVKRAEGPDKYDAVQVGAGEYKLKNVKKPVLGQLKALGLDESVVERPPYVIREFRVTPSSGAQAPNFLPEPGTRIHARHFVAGQNVDVSGISKGKGFQGGMKRHGFAGLPATHGVSRSHRAIGSTGQCQDPGKVFKGKKMPGHMGTDRKTTQNLQIVKIDPGQNLIYVRGAVAGNNGHFVEIRDSIKKPLFGTHHVHGEVAIPPLPTFDYDPAIDGADVKGHAYMKPLEERDPYDPEEAA